MSSKNEKSIRAYDRLSQKPYTDRDSSDAGVFGDLMNKPWTVREVRDRALALGKEFAPDDETLAQLESDLAGNKIVLLFTPEDVQNAVAMGIVPKNLETVLSGFVSSDGDNNIYVYRTESLEIQQRDRLTDWFLTNNRC